MYEVPVGIVIFSIFRYVFFFSNFKTQNSYLFNYVRLLHTRPCVDHRQMCFKFQRAHGVVTTPLWR